MDRPVLFTNAAKAFGHFQKLLADYPADTLHETIADFHNTVNRYELFEKAVAEDKAGRAASVEKEIRFFLDRKADGAVVVDAIKEGRLPLRVTHNDTKLNNIMMDNDTDEGICVIDLDTVMPVPCSMISVTASVSAQAPLTRMNRIFLLSLWISVSSRLTQPVFSPRQVHP